MVSEIFEHGGRARPDDVFIIDEQGQTADVGRDGRHGALSSVADRDVADGQPELDVGADFKTTLHGERATQLRG
jgi:hypothetical protein